MNLGNFYYEKKDYVNARVNYNRALLKTAAKQKQLEINIKILHTFYLEKNY